MTTNLFVVLIVVAGSALLQGVCAFAFADSVWGLVVAGVALVAVFILFSVPLDD
ncbi:hypothetical protein [Burkholderia vietnamiensis]|uniref:hypothetical protein n=1 Tax=Burkholderia vietnamiensis TaxID=60552 RepID=UPI000B1F9AD2|nr:hypothetical protein [Burkholderia vietnamiensis]